MFARIAAAFVVSTCLFAATTPFEQANELQQHGRAKDARDLLRSAASSFHASSDLRNQAKALTIAGQISVALGDYRGAIHDAESAASVRRRIHEEVGEDFNTLGLANLYLGNFPTALDYYQRALALDRKHGSLEGEIARLNNIGNVHYFEGRYSDALRAYAAAWEKVAATSTEKWNPRRRQLTLANLATVYQRVGKDGTALDLYRQLGSGEMAMPPNEQAQLLLNEGVLYRRMGDPVKALEVYRRAQGLFAAEHHRDGEIGALRNIGIAQAVDLNDVHGALETFSAALRLALASSDLRGIAQAKLYRSEVLRRLGRSTEAAQDAHAARDAAQRASLIEEEWKAEYELGKIAEDGGETARALDSYRKAVDAIESVRSGLRQAALRTEFLADKRAVYDALIALRLRDPATPAAEIFSWIERSRARTFADRLDMGPPAALADIQKRLPAETVLLDYWVGRESSATLWATNSASGIVRRPQGSEPMEAAAANLLRSLQDGDSSWKQPAGSLHETLLSGFPLPLHLVAVPDGPLGAIPLEVLIERGSGEVLLARHDITYLPAAQLLVRRRPAEHWLAPWSRQLVALGDPPIASNDAFAGEAHWQPLPASADEIRGIAQLLPGRARTYLGADARKRYLKGVAGVPLLHFSTHAVMDEESPDRSRILLAPDAPGAGFDYLFESEVYSLDLHGVDLATVSACDTARGKLIRGEGIEAFSRAFLAAGSAATLTSLWRVADRPTADFMKQFYYFLAKGESKAEALRSAKLAFLRSGTALANPRYWAAFVLNGDGWNHTRPVIPWVVIAGAAALGGGIFVLLCYSLLRERPAAAQKR